MQSALRVAIGWCLFVTAGCTGPPVVAIIKADGPLDMRVARYNQLRGTPKGERLILANGTSVLQAQRLLPLVHSASPAAEAMRDYESLRDAQLATGFSTLGVIVAGTALAIVGVAKDDATGDALAIGGAATLVGASAVGIPITWWLGKRVNETRRAAFTAYNEGLKQMLRICARGNVPQDCP